MTWSLHPGAERDIASALDFYKEHAGLAVAEHFLEEFERVVRFLVEHPTLGKPITKGRRMFPLRTFPYSIIYRSCEDNIRILVVRHQHRKPGYADSRR